MKGLKNTCVTLLVEFLQCNDGRLEEAEYFKCGLLIVFSNLTKPVLVHDLLSYNSTFML